jgi:molybdate transport system ATP-binding protein
MTHLAARLVHRFPGGFALDVDLDVEFDAAAPIVGLFGASGCGKSTTLAAIAGLLSVREGRVTLGPETLFDRASGVDEPPEARRVGLVPQAGLLFPHLSVRGNLLYGAARNTEADRPELGRVVDTLGLAPLLHRGVTELSGGERQRIALGRAILAGPRLLLLDEPVSALDDRARFGVLDFVERVVLQFAVPALYVSHRRSEMARLCSRVVRLDAGRVIGIGSAAELEGASGDAGPVWNVFRADVDAADRHVARVGAGELTLPRAAPPPDTVWLRLSSGAITLERADAAPTLASARNRLAGTVVRLDATGDRVRVLVDAGTPLQVDVTRAAVADLALEVGALVTCVFKAHALELL